MCAILQKSTPDALYSFYNAGYQSGYDHGKIHGKIEGRALGKEKGYEIWEELGFMQASAMFLLSTQPDSK